MWYRNAEDRLNPISPEGADDTTLGGYIGVHGRAPAFDGVDGAPYTVAVETERTDDGTARWIGFLIFLRWAETGTAIMGHLETEDLVEGGSEAAVRSALESLPLSRVKAILDETILHKQQGEAQW